MSYQRDLKKMWDFLKNRGVMSVSEVKELELEGYISYMEREKFAASSISRSVASIRAFFQFLWKEGVIQRSGRESETSKGRKKGTGDSYCGGSRQIIAEA